MNVLLLPRLTPVGVTHILEINGEQLAPSRAKAFLKEHSSMLFFAASGGNKSEQLTVDIGSKIREIAINSGFPSNSGQNARARFDQDVTIFLAGLEELNTGESLRNDVWAYLATVETCDIVAWRFPKRDPGRFSGGPRNAFQRLWMRGSSLDKGAVFEDRWGLIKSLTEDALVAIFERPSIGGDPILAKAIAEGWVVTAERIGRGSMESVMRRAIKLLRLRNEIIDLSGLSQSELQETVLEYFNEASNYAKTDD
ncbi:MULTISPECIES: hypothetical protein [unclassified Herbaspirillum]|uniref:hypothetical protein n=1 Tax=unclassified Herbaspirillum TaxID=2624150 RepID=UPI0010726C98|nr:MULTISPECIES: hypothetical protein [unclassified Herbaspirillum]TFI04987.1 hypothetical protein E4P32_22555 [Herbaspirillum sp. 3R11]TFI12682.1 hypothetical protein E4P31_21810 [Herbaspirillum sp. 3R-11]TFI27955.1 hypothetical protein E4P30_08570 [Herbaspirillum sp. 3C11]